MSVENANYISQLNKLAPTGSEFVSEGDDHLRVLKKAVQQSLPNITGPVTATQGQLNTVTSAEAYFPQGGIIMWSGLTTNIPSGWALCDGSNGTPDLRGRFVLGAQDQAATPHGDSTRLGSTAADKAQLLTGVSGGNWLGYTAGGTTGGTAITTAQMPAHNHNNGDYKQVISQNNAGTGISFGFGGGQLASDMLSVGSGQVHTHSMPAVFVGLMNPYLVLAYIMRTGTSFVGA